MKHQASRELLGYWNDLRGYRTAPERCDIDPTAIRSILPDTFMLDVAGRFPVRLAGTRVNALLDAEPAGAAFLDLWEAAERRNIAALLHAVADGATPVVVGAAGAPSGRPIASFEFLFLPLRHFGKTHDRILGIATAAAQPSWLGLAPAEPLRMSSMRFVEQDEWREPGARQRRGADGLRGVGVAREPEDARGPAGWPVPGLGRLTPGRPALRLIEGGRHA